MNIDNEYLRRFLAPRGFTMPGGGNVCFPPGAHDVVETLEFGGPDITVRGQGQGGVTLRNGAWESYGQSVLRWAGHADEPMLRAHGCTRFDIGSLGLRVDSADGGYASEALVLSAHNDDGLIGGTQGPKVSRVSIVAPRDRINDSIGIHITGTDYNDQVDRVQIDGCDISGIGTGVKQTSQQSVATRIVGCNLSCWHRNVEILDGSAIIESCLMSERRWSSGTSDFIAVHLGANPDAEFHTAHDCHILRNAFEMHTGRFIVIDAPTSFPQGIHGNKFLLQNQAPGSVMTILDSISDGTVTVTGSNYNSPTGGGGLIYQHGEGRLLHDESNFKRRWMGDLIVVQKN